MSRNREETPFKVGDQIYCVSTKGSYCHIFLATITGDCEVGPGFMATTDCGFVIDTCGLKITRTMQEARAIAHVRHKKMLNTLKEKQRTLSGQLNYLLWAVDNPTKVQRLRHDFGMGEDEIARRKERE